MSEQPASPDQTQTRNKVDAFSKHPLGPIIINFALTGICVTLLTSWFNYSINAHNQRMNNFDKAQNAVKQITDLMYERRTTASMVASSIRRDASIKEIEDRKDHYDGVYTKYNATLQSNIFSIRSIDEADNYNIFNSFIQTRLAPMLAVHDRCITASYDLAVSDDVQNRYEAKNALDHCAYGDAHAHVDIPDRMLVTLILRCEYALTNALSLSIEGSHLTDKTGQKMIYNMQKFCNITSNWRDIIDESY